MQQGLNLREQKNIKNQLQKHREELELLELQIQQEQRNGLNKFQNSSNINISISNNHNINNNNSNSYQLEERKAKSSLSRQQPQNTNEQSNKMYKGQNVYIESYRNSNNSPVKQSQSNNSNSPTVSVNNNRPLGIRLSQAGQDVLLPNKNKVSVTMDEAQIIQTNQLNNLMEYKYNSKASNYKGVVGSEIQSPPYQRSGVINNNYKVQSQIGNSNYQIQQKNESYPQIYINQQQNQVQNRAKYNTDQYSRGVKNASQYPQLENRENGNYNLANQPQAHSQINLQIKQQKGHSSPEITQLPHNLKNLSIVKLPNEDEVHFDELNLQTEGYLIEKYCEFLNNDNDLFYLEGNFSRLYSSSIQSYLNSEQKESNAFKGALAVCFDAQNPQTDFKYIHPNFKVSLKKIANNPMIYAGLASQGASTLSNNNQDQINQSRILSNSKLNSPHSEQSSNQGFASNFNNFISKKQNSQDQDSLSQNQNYMQQGSREGTKGMSSQGLNKSNNINRSYTNSTNTNLSFFNKKLNFQIPQISVNDLMSELQKIQQEYRTHKVLFYKIFIVTKFKVRIDLGFLQISFNMNTPNSQKPYSQCIIHRLFISRIYRKLNYAQFIYLQVYNFLFATYPNLEKVSITLSNLSQQYLRFKQSIGFRLENIKSANEQSCVSQQVRLVLKRSDFAQIFNHIHSNKKFVDKPGLDNQALNLQQNKLPSNKLVIPSF